MSRPTDAPEWASDASYPAGTDAWSATDTKIEPTSGEKGTGATPQTGFGAQQFNWLLNNLAEWVNHLDSINVGAGFLQSDEFLAATLSDMWTSLTNVTAGSDDAADDGFGTAHIVYAGTDVGGIQGARRFPLFTRDWMFYARVRVLSWTASTLELGLSPAGGGHWTGFKSTTASPTWKASADYVGGETDTSVASNGGVYQEMVMVYDSDSGDLKFYIDGALEHTESSAVFGATTMNLHFYASGSAANIHLDKIALWVDR